MPEQVMLSQDWLLESIRESIQRLYARSDSGGNSGQVDNRHLLDKVAVVLSPTLPTSSQ